MRAPNAVFWLFLLKLSACCGQELPGAAGTQSRNASSQRTLGGYPQPSTLKNVTGSYRGSWRKLKSDMRSADFPLLLKDAGTMFLHLSATAATIPGMQQVKGEMVLREGERFTEDDVFFRIDGLFVEETGRLHAVVASSAPLMYPNLEASDFEKMTYPYREALRKLAKRWERGAREAVAYNMEEQFRAFNYQLPDAGMSRMTKSCDFVLDLGVAARVGDADAILSRRSLLEAPPPLKAIEAADAEDAEADFVVMSGALVSEVCGVAMQLDVSSTRVEVYYSKAVNYTLKTTIVTFIQIILLLRQIEASSSQAHLANISLLTIAHQAIIDAYLCLLHLTTAMMVEPLFNALATAAFFEFIIFAVFEIRFMLNIWKARQGNTLDARAQQRHLLGLYGRFYFALLCTIFVSFQAQRFLQPLCFLVFSFWIPQIVLSAYQDTRQPLRPLYVLGTSASRLVLPLYLYGCPSNILKMPTSLPFCVALSTYMTAQVALLLGQTWLGPRFFIPKSCLPPKYDYFRGGGPQPAVGEGGPPRDVETGYGGMECVICMNVVDVQDCKARMLTPCNHYFHRPCLQRWMDVKMECPTCRAVLPPE